MSTTRTRASFLAVALLANMLMASTLSSREAHACTCAAFPVEKEIRVSDAVFSGEVQSIDSSATLRNGRSVPGKVTIDVQETWKGGVSADPVDVYGQGDGGNCYNMLEKDETYLVYASHAEEEGAAYLKNIKCGATKRLADAGADLRILGPPQGSLPDTGGHDVSALKVPTILAASFGLLVLVGALALRRTADR